MSTTIPIKDKEVLEEFKNYYLKKENYRNYIQYGKPKYDVEEDFLPIKMKGRIYARYFAKQDCSIYFYVLAKDYDVLEKCDKEILSKSEVLLLDEN